MAGKETPQERVARLKKEAADTRREIQRTRGIKAKTAEQIKRERAKIAKQQAKQDERRKKIEALGDKKRNIAKRLAHALRHIAPVFTKTLLGGHPMVATQLCVCIAYGVVKFHLYVTATGDGTHATNSWHYAKPPRAVDMAAAMTAQGIEQMKKYQRFAARKWQATLLELFGPDSFYIKNGQRIAGAFPDHGDHTHTAR